MENEPTAIPKKNIPVLESKKPLWLIVFAWIDITFAILRFKVAVGPQVYPDSMPLILRLFLPTFFLIIPVLFLTSKRQAETYKTVRALVLLEFAWSALGYLVILFLFYSMRG